MVWNQQATSAFIACLPRNSFTFRTNTPLASRNPTLVPTPRQSHRRVRQPALPKPQITMGIKGLTKLLGDNAPGAIRPQEVHALLGRKIAVDASMCIYQLLVAVRMGADNLTNTEGKVTSHLTGLFYRSIRLLELGIKPVFVFDGKPPEMKGGELARRAEARKLAEEGLQKAKDEGDMEAATRFSRRINRVTPEMMKDCKSLLKFMGVPIVEAPCEAEAQCAEMVKKGLVYATASEDMDSLTFGTEKMIRYLWAGTASTAAKKGIKPTEFTLSVALEELDLDMPQFIDLCILCGCDYTDGIKGVGVVKALTLMRKHKDLQTIVDVLRTEKKYVVPEEYPVDSLRKMFIEPEITDASKIILKWGKPKVEGLKKFLIEDNQFDPVKVENGLKRLEDSKKVTNQVRVDSFFKKKVPSKDGVAAAKKKGGASPLKASSLKGKAAKRSGTPLKGAVAKKKKST